jgi:hypothetical protein
MSYASLGFALPVNTIRLSYAMAEEARESRDQKGRYCTAIDARGRI